MHAKTEGLSHWCYDGLWGVLTQWFKVPRRPPDLPSRDGETVASFQPAVGFLQYLKFQFWIWLTLIDVGIFIVWIVITIGVPILGVILAVPAILVAVFPDIFAYLAVHLRFDTTWYVMSDRSLRIRRGIWLIRETTITFENVQNVAVRQGPLQRWFGIADVIVETAGGGSLASQAQSGSQGTPAHLGLIEGVSNAQTIRDQILRRLRESRSAGLGDEENGRHEPVEPKAHWNHEHIAVLREIRDAAAALCNTA